ncbi:MAG: hypothetical protein QNK30_13530 [Bacteroidales bacterium]|nr:hypothetical protein [Bacteroidales bacterium]
MEDLFIVLVIFGAIFGVFYLFFTTRNKERLALIENGADAKLFNTGKKFAWRNFSLSAGMFLIGIALGVLIAGILDATTEIHEGVAYPSMIFLFAGISLVIYFFLARKLRNGEK